MKKMPKTGDLIYFGIPDDSIFFDGAFRVLDPEQTNTGEAGMFLLYENLISRNEKHGFYFRDEKKPGVNTYRGSDAKRWCAAFVNHRFTEAERSAMMSTFKSDGAYVKIHKWELLGGKTSDGKCPFVAEPECLDGDRLFLLSTEEADNPKYGFTDHSARIAGLNGKAAAWWLRSPHAPDFPIDVGLVFFNGWLLDFTENKDSIFGLSPACMRPAFNLDLARVSAFEEIREGEWLVMLAGETPAEQASKGERYRFGARKPIETRKEPTGISKFLTALCMTVFIGGVDLYRKLTGKAEV